MRTRMTSRIFATGLMVIVITMQAPGVAQISTTGTLISPPEAPDSTDPEVNQPTTAPDEPFDNRAELETSEQAASPERGGELHLICFGGGSANKADVATAFGSQSGTAFSSNGNMASYNGSSNATIIGRRAQSFEDEVMIRLVPDDPRLRMPSSMLPLFRGGEDGWFKLRNVEVKDGEIRASVAVALLNNPKMRIDRYTGSISISGKAGDYTGQCERYDPAAMERQF